MSSPYDDLKRVLGKDSDERILAELEPLEEWFRKRSKVFEKLPRGWYLVNNLIILIYVLILIYFGMCMDSVEPTE